MNRQTPRALLRNSRPVDPRFHKDEKLFIRFSSISSDGKVDSSDIKCPNQSVNRGKYCAKPEWVLCHPEKDFSWWGHGWFKVAEIPRELREEAQHTYHFRPHHDPEEQNYSHSVIAAHKDNPAAPSVDRVTPNTVKSKFKLLIREKIHVLKPPENPAQ